MVNWKEHNIPLFVGNFAWAKDDAWLAGNRDGKFYWYAAVYGSIPGKKLLRLLWTTLPVPFKDARGSVALITNNMTTETKISWDDIDPTVIIDNGRHTFCKHTKCYAKFLKRICDRAGWRHSKPLISILTVGPWIHMSVTAGTTFIRLPVSGKLLYAMSQKIYLGPGTSQRAKEL